MGEELPDPDADREAWARLAHRERIERKARWRARWRRAGPAGPGPLEPLPTPPDDTSGDEGSSDRPGPDLTEAEMYGTFRNREEAEVAFRALEGLVPVLVLIAPVWVILGILWLDFSSLLALVLWVVSTAIYATLAGVGLRQIGLRTPDTVEVRPEGLTASWGGRPPTARSVPFDRVLSVDPRSWRWTHGKGAYARYFPPSVQFSTAPPGVVTPSGTLPPEPGILYLTEMNRARVRAAWHRWETVIPPDPPAPLPSASDSPLPG